ncbi:putative dnaJ subfamily C member 17 [Paratrimastix pyriformis]|uniref:DnaJ subfamily C member 17 n=1 Tax=Paratrimastix pyriformis TaxID=342808 RepID=A0ABQ8UFZ0_9EUKA|nr:putative dnaJ subfamily C member 17 [Paratrimastix pyriformis]
MSNENFYAVLGIQYGANEADIKKAYRKKALECHPDKTKDPSAVALFQKITRAYEVLLDPAARKAFDDVVRVHKEREEREKGWDDKRRQMKRDLLERENHFRQQRQDEDVARQKLQAEIARLQEEGRLRQMREQRDRSAEGISSIGMTPPTATATRATPLMSEEEHARLCTLQIRWDKKISHYSEDALHDLLCVFGAIESIVVSSKKGNALVVFQAPEAAVRLAPLPVPELTLTLCAPQNAVLRCELGSVNNRLRCGFADFSKVGRPAPSPSHAHLVRPAVAASLPGPVSHHHADVGGLLLLCLGQRPAEEPVCVAVPHDYEAATLLRMRQAAERQRLIKEIQAQQAQQAPSPSPSPSPSPPASSAADTPVTSSAPHTSSPPTATRGDAADEQGGEKPPRRRRLEEIATPPAAADTARAPPPAPAQAARAGPGTSVPPASPQPTTGLVDDASPHRRPPKHTREGEHTPPPPDRRPEGTTFAVGSAFGVGRRAPAAAEGEGDDDTDVFLKPAFLRAPHAAGLTPLAPTHIGAIPAADAPPRQPSWAAPSPTTPGAAPIRGGRGAVAPDID